MAEQQSKGSLAVTKAPFENPFDTSLTRFGVEGLNITDAIDAVKPNEMTRMVNVTHRVDGGVTVRQGLTADASSDGSNHHTQRLLDAHGDLEPTIVHGIDTTLHVGLTGVLSSIDTGYSGSPLSMVPFHSPLNGEPWMYVADYNKMSKVRSDGTVLPIGLPAPAAVATAVLDTEKTINLANFTDDGTTAASWVATAGKTLPDSDDETVVDTTTLPVLASPVTPPGGAAGVAFSMGVPQLTPIGGGAASNFWNLWGVQINRNLDFVDDFLVADEDYIHFWLRILNTAAILEIRLYFVITSAFDPTKLPGEPPTSGTIVWNSDAYWVSIQPPDVSGALSAIRIRENDRIALEQLADEDVTIPTIATGPGSGTWNEYASAGMPLRRGDFQRIGNDPDLGWHTISGIVIYAVGAKGAPGAGFQIADMYCTGGSNPDSGEATSTPYDYRYTHYDTLTGAEGNPADSSADIDALRRAVIITPGESYGNDHTVQRFYRRGGTLPTDWFFLGENDSDGADFNDNISDTEAVAAGSLEINNNQPVASVDIEGNTILNQPLSSLWGPQEGLLMGCGDVLRPGHVYFCKLGNAESWPPENRTEVCAPSEQLLGGCMFGGQAYVFSAVQMFALYPNLSGDVTGVTSITTQCKKGLVDGARWGFVVGMGGIYFVSSDGIYKTTGGPAEWLSKSIDPIFRGETKNGVLPIDFSSVTSLRLEIFENELYFLYQDTNGDSQCMVLSLIYGYWRQYNSSKSISSFYNVVEIAEPTMRVGAKTLGVEWLFEGTSDDGAAIACQVRTGAMFFGQDREEKRLGDQVIDVDPQGVDISLQNYYNYETSHDGVGTLPTASERSRIIVDAFGTEPQRAINVSTDISWSASGSRPVLYYLGTSAIVEPEVTTNRVTQWDDLQSGDEVYLTGVTLDVDTLGDARTILIEVDIAGATSTAYTATVTSDGRHKVKFSWPAVQANKVRIRPADPTCAFWILYKAEWMFQAEPPRISKWDSYFENGWDQYCTGLDLYCNTFGATKTVECYVDGVLVQTESVNTNGRLVHHITIPWVRGHVFHFISTDANPGMLYGHRWQLQEEPSEQANWNQNFSVEGTEAGKYLKAVVFQCDTFGLDKTVTVECDGVVVETLTINTNGRKVVQKSFPQHYGNVFRIYPTDTNPSRLYTSWMVFDQEPLALERWETQEIDHRISGWHYLIYAHVALRSVAAVNLRVVAYNQSGVATTKDYTLASTSGAKQKVFVPFEATKGILYKYIVTSAEPFWLYRDETIVMVREWGTGATEKAHPFGNDDLDATRVMTKPALAAARSGGGTGA